MRYPVLPTPTLQSIVACDDARYAAMIGGDLPGLAMLLADGLTYTHSTGVTETKAQYLQALRSGRVRYLQMDRQVAHFLAFPGCAVMQGQVGVHAQVDGRTLRSQALFTSTWVGRDGSWQMAAWAATPAAAPAGA